MSERTLRKNLIRLASSLPARSAGRQDILAILSDPDIPIGAAGLRKQASPGDAADFATWALNAAQGNPMDTKAVEAFIKGLGVKVNTEGRSGRPGPRWQVGDEVCIVASKHKYGGAEVYRMYDGKRGVVTDDGGGGKGASITIRIGSHEVEFPEAQNFRNVGLKKYSDWSKLKGYGPIECVYKKSPSNPPSTEQIVQAESYVARGRPGETRSLNYFSGYVFNAAMGKNGFYFSILAQQRIPAGPCEDFFGWRSFNPGEGQVLYIGRLGKRPSGWEKELADMRAGAAVIP